MTKSVDAHAPAASEESYHLRDGKRTPDQGGPEELALTLFCKNVYFLMYEFEEGVRK